MKILILKPSSLGDVVQALPVLRLLKLHWPESEIFWWLDAGLAPLLADDPDLAGIFPFHKKNWGSPRQWLELGLSATRLRKERFDLAIDLQGLARSGLFTWLSNAELSIGLDNPREGKREGARLFYDRLALSSAIGTHAVERYLAVLPALGVPVHFNFQWLRERPRTAGALRTKWPVAGTRWVALLPGARWWNKRWPAAHFQETSRRLLATQSDLRLVVLGSSEDRTLGEEIAAAAPGRIVDLTGQTSLGEMVEWLRLSSLVITNDTGPMHVAAALRKPVIAMFGPTDPGSTGPYGQLENVIQSNSLPCVPCMKGHCLFERTLACLKDITPELVVERARAVLEA